MNFQDLILEIKKAERVNKKIVVLYTTEERIELKFLNIFIIIEYIQKSNHKFICIYIQDIKKLVLELNDTVIYSVLALLNEQIAFYNLYPLSTPKSVKMQRLMNIIEFNSIDFDNFDTVTTNIIESIKIQYNWYILYMDGKFYFDENKYTVNPNKYFVIDDNRNEISIYNSGEIKKINTYDLFHRVNN